MTQPPASPAPTPGSHARTERYIVSLTRDVPALRSMRGHVDDLVSGNRHYFASVDELVRFFRSVAER